MHLKLLNKAIQKTAEAIGDLISNKIANNIRKVSKSSPQNNSERETEILKERYISPEKRQQVIEEPRSI